MRHHSSRQVLQYTMLVGGTAKRDCVKISIDSDRVFDERLRDFLTPRVAKMSVVTHDEGCCEEGLDRGPGTVTMVRLALFLVKRMFPFVEEVHFDDMSSVNCDEDVSVSLAHMHAAVYGKTWYERWFGAELLYDAQHTVYRTRIAAFDSAAYKSFHERTMADKFIPKNLRISFEKCETLRSFFASLRSERSRVEFCRTIAPFVTQLVDYVLEEPCLNAKWKVKTFYDMTPHLVDFDTNVVNEFKPYAGGSKTTTYPPYMRLTLEDSFFE